MISPDPLAPPDIKWPFLPPPGRVPCRPDEETAAAAASAMAMLSAVY